ncbi:unannotated protein [freshwater metagenome]|uniref:Unannotated protein n=1 Tax=freshwater metagenome TaxID=449393 RepID=A0A6J7HJK0_9ZZZZ
MTVLHEEIDAQHHGRERFICCHRIGDVIIDPGPAVSCQNVVAALGGEAPRAILLTHIHLDHAGGAGTLARLWPDTEIWVHERGAPHLIDPSRLLASALRIYGDRMDELWGPIEPIAADRVRVLHGGETVDGFRVAYTPGHAVHHVSFLHEETGIAFTGDVAGMRYGSGFVLPPTPPPDIDLDAWEASIRLLESWDPQALGITHFGTYTDVAEHLGLLRESLAFLGRRARTGPRETFEADVLAWMTERAAPETLTQYGGVGVLPSYFDGLARHWARHDAG